MKKNYPEPIPRLIKLTPHLCAALLFFFGSITTKVWGQIITNGSFEKVTQTPTHASQLNFAVGWESPSGGSPDLFRKQNGFAPVVGVPSNFWGTQAPLNPNDSSYGGIYIYAFTGNGTILGYKEYLKYKLDAPMLPGHSYSVSYFVNAADMNGDFVDRLGAYFAKSWTFNSSYLTLHVTPQIVSPANQFFNDKNNWTLLNGFVTPIDTFNIMILGSFDSVLNFKSGDTMGHHAIIYYYYDSVTISEIHCHHHGDSSFTFSTPTCGAPVKFTRNSQVGTSHWDFGDGSTSDENNPSHSYAEGGIYIVKHTLNDTCAFTAIDTVKLLNCCMCKPCGPNLVRNGDFSAPCHTAYSSDLTAVGCPNAYTSPNEYTEATDAHICNGDAWCGLDHTGKAGSKFLIADGPFEYRPGGSATLFRAWYQKVGKVVAGHRYCFTAYVKNVCHDCADKPNLKLQIDASGTKYIVDAIEDLAYNECCEAGWTKMCGSWTATTGIDSVELSVIITRGEWMGNDAGIDDISFSETNIKPSAAFTTKTTICLFTPDTFTSANTNGSHQWTFGDGSSSTDINPVHTYKKIGNYTVKHIITTACGKDTVTKIVHVVDCCCKICYTNLVTNGDFSNPSCFTNYYTDLTLNPCRAIYSHSDSITEDSNAQAIIPGWYGKDHTGVAGSRFLIVDFPWNVIKRAWYKPHVHVTPGKIYCFSMYVKNLAIYSAPYNSPSFDLRINGINGTLIKHVDQLTFDSSWEKVCGEWTAGPNDTSVELDLVAYPGVGNGFDLGVDDIQFAERCTYESGGGGGGQNSPQAPPHFNTPGDPTSDLLVAPIPLQRGTNLQVSYSSPKTQNLDIFLYDNNGKLVLQKNQLFNIGVNGITVETKSLAPGLYYLRLSGEAENYSRKIIVTE